MHPRRELKLLKELRHRVKHKKGFLDNQPTQGNEGDPPNPLGLTNPEHIARYSVLSRKLVVTTHYFDEDLLTSLELLDDIRWLFARQAMGQFLEAQDHTYRDLTLEFLSTLHVEITSGSRFQEGYIFFISTGNFVS